MTTLFPLTLDLASKTLTQLAPAVIWIAALLASLLSLPQLWRDDFSDGSLVQLVLGPMPLSLMVLAKVLAHWLVLSFPLLVMTPVVALMFHLPFYALKILLLTLLLGTPILHLAGAFVAALTVGLRQASVLLALILMPLFIPSLIFATSAVSAALNGGSIFVPIYLLAAILTLALTSLPFLCGFALRISVNYD